MKNRKRIIVAFMLVAVLLLSVGYAALTDDLFITGDATLNTTQAQNEFDADIYFSAADVQSSTGTYLKDGSGADVVDKADVVSADSARFNVLTLAQRDEVVTFIYTITNDSEEFDAVITADPGYPTTNDPTNFEITYDMDANQAGVQTEGTVSKGGNTLQILVTVKLLNSPAENTTATFNFDITATSK